jgi:diguanylate cyclase (GGDEF)-like protein
MTLLDPTEQNRRQRVRLERLALAVAACSVTVGMTLLVALAGYLRYTAAAIYMGLVAGLCALFYGMIRSGLNRRFSDPSLTVPQLVAAGLTVSYAAYEGAEARPAFMAMYLIAYMFGVFALGVRGLVWIAVFYVGCYISVAILSLLIRPAVTDVNREIFRIVALALMLGWMTMLGRYISGLRHNLRRANAELKRALARAEELANHDGLTGCNNRRRMMELLVVETKRATRGSPLSVCLVDLDHFKFINDDHGHLSGDEVLKEFAATAQAELRATDFLARYGGEEFLIGLSNTALAEAIVVAERIRRAVAQRSFSELPPGRRVTVSIGTVEHCPPEPIDRTLSRVDTALYEAKRQGRNRVVGVT